jgi:hypothetical protein
MHRAVVEPGWLRAPPESADLSANLCWTTPFSAATIIGDNIHTSAGCHDYDEITSPGLQSLARLHPSEAS